MCTAVLQQELNQTVQGMPDANVRLLIEVAKSMRAGGTASDPVGRPQKKGGVNPRILGALKGGLVYMADDFDETPECFKEYQEVAHAYA